MGNKLKNNNKYISKINVKEQKQKIDDLAKTIDFYSNKKWLAIL